MVYKIGMALGLALLASIAPGEAGAASSQAGVHMTPGVPVYYTRRYYAPRYYAPRYYAPRYYRPRYYYRPYYRPRYYYYNPY